jgi:hypothetical protein
MKDVTENVKINNLFGATAGMYAVNYFAIAPLLRNFTYITPELIKNAVTGINMIGIPTLIIYMFGIQRQLVSLIHYIFKENPMERILSRGICAMIVQGLYIGIRIIYYNNSIGGDVLSIALNVIMKSIFMAVITYVYESVSNVLIGLRVRATEYITSAMSSNSWLNPALSWIEYALSWVMSIPQLVSTIAHGPETDFLQNSAYSMDSWINTFDKGHKRPGSPYLLTRTVTFVSGVYLKLGLKEVNVLKPITRVLLTGDPYSTRLRCGYINKFFAFASAAALEAMIWHGALSLGLLPQSAMTSIYATSPFAIQFAYTLFHKFLTGGKEYSEIGKDAMTAGLFSGVTEVYNKMRKFDFSGNLFNWSTYIAIMGMTPGSPLIAILDIFNATTQVDVVKEARKTNAPLQIAAEEFRAEHPTDAISFINSFDRNCDLNPSINDPNACELVKITKNVRYEQKINIAKYQAIIPHNCFFKIPNSNISVVTVGAPETVVEGCANDFMNALYRKQTQEKSKSSNLRFFNDVFEFKIETNTRTPVTSFARMNEVNAAYYNLVIRSMMENIGIAKNETKLVEAFVVYEVRMLTTTWTYDPDEKQISSALYKLLLNTDALVSKFIKITEKDTIFKYAFQTYSITDAQKDDLLDKMQTKVAYDPVLFYSIMKMPRMIEFMTQKFRSVITDGLSYDPFGGLIETFEGAESMCNEFSKTEFYKLKLSKVIEQIAPVTVLQIASDAREIATNVTNALGGAITGTTATEFQNSSYQWLINFVTNIASLNLLNDIIQNPSQYIYTIFTGMGSLSLFIFGAVKYVFSNYGKNKKEEQILLITQQENLEKKLSKAEKDKLNLLETEYSLEYKKLEKIEKKLKNAKDELNKSATRENRDNVDVVTEEHVAQGRITSSAEKKYKDEVARLKNKSQSIINNIEQQQTQGNPDPTTEEQSIINQITATIEQSMKKYFTSIKVEYSPSELHKQLLQLVTYICTTNIYILS